MDRQRHVPPAPRGARVRRHHRRGRRLQPWGPRGSRQGAPSCCPCVRPRPPRAGNAARASPPRLSRTRMEAGGSKLAQSPPAVECAKDGRGSRVPPASRGERKKTKGRERAAARCPRGVGAIVAIPTVLTVRVGFPVSTYGVPARAARARVRPPPASARASPSQTPPRAATSREAPPLRRRPPPTVGPRRRRLRRRAERPACARQAAGSAAVRRVPTLGARMVGKHRLQRSSTV